MKKCKDTTPKYFEAIALFFSECGLKCLTASVVVLALSACNSSHKEVASQNSPESEKIQKTEQPEKTPKRAVLIDQIDFSNYPGVLKQGAFGYYFGLTVEQIEEAGIEVKMEREGDDLLIASVSSAPVPWEDAENYLMAFYDGKLLKINAIGKNITGDATGTKGREKHKELRDSLAEKYGKPSKSFHSVGNKLWNEADEFYQCLNYDGCGVWVDFWNLKDKIISLEINSTGRRGEGYIKIGYEAAPEWSDALDAVKAKKKLSTKKGL
jgi:hypothetical protein